MISWHSSLISVSSPNLVAGPIERATHLLPQFLRPRNFDCDLALDGIRQMLWGFFKKVVVADNCALFVNGVFENYQTLDGSTLFLGAFFFTIQIYGDFFRILGYSDRLCPVIWHRPYAEL